MSTDQTDFEPASDLHPYMRAPRAQATAERAEHLPSLEALYDMERPDERFDVKSYVSKPFQAVPIKRDYVVQGKLIRQGDMLIKTDATADDGKPIWGHVYQESFEGREVEPNAVMADRALRIIHKLFPACALRELEQFIAEGSRAVLIALDHNIAIYGPDEECAIYERGSADDPPVVVRLAEYRKLVDSLKHERERAEVNKKTVDLLRQQLDQAMATIDSVQSACNIHREIAHVATHQRNQLENAIAAAAGIIEQALGRD